MSEKRFVHLHTLTDSSVYSSTLKYSDLFDHVNEIALTDNHWCQIFEFHDEPYSYVKKMKEQKNINLNVNDYKTIFGFKAKVENVLLIDELPQEVILIAKNKNGFQNLLNLTSEMYLSENEVLSWEAIEERKEDLICISGSLSTEIGYCLYKRKSPDVIVDYLFDLFGENFFLEIQEHFLGEAWEENATQYCLNRLDIPLVLTNEVRYLNRDDAHRSCVYFVSSPKSVKPSMERSRFTYSSEFYLKSADEMYGVAEYIARNYENGHRAFEAFTNTSLIADIIDRVDLKQKESHMPYVEDADNQLRKLCYDYMPDSYPTTYNIEVEGTGRYVEYNDAQNRIEYELNEISSKDYSGYFMILFDFIEHCHKKGITIGAGRGSAVSSAVLYVLKIVQADPLKYDLLFERFLNPKRISEPDVDIDIESSRRAEAMEYLVDKYGEDHIAQILTIGRLQGRSALRSVCKGLGIPLQEEDRLAKLLPSYVGMTLKHCLYGDGKAIEADANVVDEYHSNEQSKMIFDIALWVEEKELISKFSIHAGGVVISKDNLFDYCPLIKGDALKSCVAMTMKRVEKNKFSKFDILGVKILDVIKKCMNRFNIKNIRDIPIDPVVFDYLNQGETFGIFQFNKCGDIVKQMKVESISDLTVITALNRPGPMAQIPTFIKRKHGEVYDVYDNRLKAVLEPTFGILVYQESIMQTAQVMCGYDLGEADLLRRAIGKKERETIEKERKNFIERAVQNSFSEEVAVIIYDLIEFFCDYGFNKSHAVAYAYTAYICAYFKCYDPVFYMSAMLEAHQSDNEDMDNSPFYLRKECERMGISFSPPDINEGDMSYSPYKEEATIQYGLTSLKYVGESQAVKIMDNRPYYSFDDFVQRAGVSNRTTEALIKAGSFDHLADRSNLLNHFEQYTEVAVASENEFTLFDLLGEKIFEEKEPLSDLEILEGEKEVLGTYLSDHPIKHYKDQMKGSKFVEIASAEDRDEQFVHIGCIVSKVKPWKSKKGCFATIEDDTGSMDAMIFTSTFEKLGLINMKDICGKPIVLEGKYTFTDNKITVKDAYFLKEDEKEVLIQVNDEKELQSLFNFLGGLKKGNTRLVIYNAVNRKIVVDKRVVMTDSKKNVLSSKFDGRILVK